MKRCSRLFLLLLMLVLLLVGCKLPTDTPDEISTTDVPSTTEPAVEGLAIVTDGVANYRIVRGEEASADFTDVAIRVRQMISNATDVMPEIATDWVKKGTDPDHESLEILVGPTIYSESAEALEGLGYGDYIITRIGNKIVINARCADAMNAAYTAFRNLIRDHLRDGDLILPTDLRITGTGNKCLNQLPYFDHGTLSTLYNAGGDTELAIFTETTPDAYSAYLQKLASSGYTLYTENRITDNFFATYINDTYVIHAGYYAYEEAVRVTVEPRTALPPREGDNTYEKKTQPNVGQLGCEFPGSDGTNVSNGQSQILQLSDGSYIVIDGGCLRDIEAQMLYDYMFEYAPDPGNITIAAWIFTHGHSDHTGGYEAFTKRYASRVKLELLIGNFPDRAVLFDGEGPSGDRIPASTASYPGSKWIQAHVGQVFHLRDAKVEILYTLESYAPRDLAYYNTSSMVFTVELADQTFNFLGDASNDACKIVYEMYGTDLKADFIQPAHHGFSTGSSVHNGVTSVYTASAAPVVLWPAGERAYEITVVKRAYSAHLVNLESTKEIFVAGSRVIRLMLPYTVGTSGYESILKQQ